MKTIEEIRNEEAIKFGYDNYDDIFEAQCEEYITDLDFKIYNQKCMEEYAKQMCIEQRRLCYVDYNLDKNVLDTQLATENK